MTYVRKEELAEGIVLYEGDSFDVLPTLPVAELCLTDPPYGIGADKAASKNNGKWGWTYYGETDWDALRPSKELAAWNKASAEARQEFLARIETPVMDAA